VIIELRAQVLIGFLLLVSLALSTFSSKACWTKGPFLSERPML
jgi:hypothetical protein